MKNLFPFLLLFVLFSCENNRQEMDSLIEQNLLKKQNKELLSLNNKLDSLLGLIEEKGSELNKERETKLSTLKATLKKESSMRKSSSGGNSSSYDNDFYSNDNSSSNYYTKERCGGRIENRWEEYSNYTNKIELKVQIECPYCSYTKTTNIRFKGRDSDCDEIEHECSIFGGCGKKSILKPCLIKHLDKGDKF